MRETAPNILNRVITYYPYPAILDEVPLQGHAVIEASAGTGKTYTIEHLVVDRLLKTKSRLEQLLVVTFTDKATGELRKRIRDLIERILKASEGEELTDPEKDPPPHHWAITINAQRKLERALFSFERAAIFTIHAFCRKVLVDLAFDSGQLFEQELVDGRRAFKEAWRDALRNRVVERSDFREALSLWLDQRQDLGSLERLLYQAYSLGYLDLQKPTQHEALTHAQRLIAVWDYELILSAFEESAIVSKALDAAKDTLSQINLLMGEEMGVEDKRIRLLTLELDTLLQPHRSSSKKKLRFPDDLPDPVKAILDHISQLKLLAEIDSAPERQVVDALLPQVNRSLIRMKRRAGQVDYDDLMRCVWNALCSPQGANLAQTLRDRFRYALIDEFQDTDPLQWKIFRRVFVDENSPHHALYIIGDPKQAIYTFRGADVHTYIQARYELIRTGAARVPLKMNYRSSPMLISAINHILDQEGNSPLFQGPIQYSEPVMSGLTDLRIVNADGREVHPVTLWRYRPPPPSKGRPALSVTQLKRAFSQQLASQVQSLLYSPHDQLFIERDGNRRPITPRDILILVRENREALEVATALREREIPFTLYKPEGLLQGIEAREIFHLLQALVDPHDRGSRLRAFTTPFFGVAWSEVYLYSTLPPGDARLERLLSWHKLALDGRYTALFYQLLHHSGISERELFFAESERELTNYQHIFEILLLITSRDRMTPAELCTKMGRMLIGVDTPPNADDNIQRLYSDRLMVQVMTVHKSKGLEAPLIMLYGGFGRPLERQVNVIQDPEEGRRVLVGSVARKAVSQRLMLEQRQEDQRLLYVALTRPQVKLFLPYIDSSRPIQGSYAPLKDRLRAIVDDREQLEQWDKLFEVVDVGAERAHTLLHTGRSLTQWIPPTEMMDIPDERHLMAGVRSRHKPLTMTSYTRLKEQGGSSLGAWDADTSELDDETTYDPSVEEITPPADEGEALPGGRHMGRCLHEIIEELPFRLFPELQNSSRGRSPQPAQLEAHSLHQYSLWSSDPIIITIFEAAMRRHGIASRWLVACQRLIYAVLNQPISLRSAQGLERELPPLCRTRHIIEMEFLFPIPEHQHPHLEQTRVALEQTPIGHGALSLSPDERLPWRVKRGFVKGFIDFIFEFEGKIYFADWKSDQLLKYSGSDFKRYIEDHYLLQAQLYTLGVVRWLKLDNEASYEDRFGGLFYFFLRAFSPHNERGEGVYYSRPTWDDVCQYERELGGLIDRLLSTQRADT